MNELSKRRELAAFLPAVLEIQETPPNPLAKWSGRSMMAFFVITVILASVGQVNIVATAEGKIIPSTRVKQVQPLEKSVVRHIFVREGERVEQGQALVELDTTATRADEKRLSGELQSAQDQLAVSRALLALLDSTVEQQAKISYASLELVVASSSSQVEQRLYKNLLWQRWLAYRANLSALESLQARNHAEQAATRAVITKLTKTLPIVARRTAKLKNLQQKQYASESEYLKLEQELIQQEQDLAAEKQRLNQLLAGATEAKQKINALIAQSKSEQLVQIADSQRQVAGLQEELTKASERQAKQTLHAPISGRVQELAISTIGGVVTEAQKLMIIVPIDEQLEVNVLLENKDIGFVHEGMPAAIKIHTFPFTKYGVIEGTVTTVSNDAIVDEQRGLVYSMEVAMAENTIAINRRDVKLMPGMAVTVEVETGQRKLIEFFLAPLLRYGQESLRER